MSVERTTQPMRAQGLNQRWVPAAPRRCELFNVGWRFVKGDPPDFPDERQLPDWCLASGDRLRATPLAPTRAAEYPHEVSYARPQFDDAGWRPVDLPHDWGIEGPFVMEEAPETGKRDCWGAAWYRKRFFLKRNDDTGRVYLDFDGAMAQALVWINGRFVGGWPYGYASFRIDLTPYARWGGENVVAVRLHNLRDSSRWYPGAGLYRDLWLLTVGTVHIAQWGVRVTCRSLSDERVRVAVQLDVENHTEADTRVYLRADIYELDGSGGRSNQPIGVTGPAHLRIAGKGRGRAELWVDLIAPKLWSVNDPQRHIAVAVVRRGDELLDREAVRFGIRTAQWDAYRGFLLNGRLLRLNGVCLHHDLGALGAAFHRGAAERQLTLLRDMGANAIRTSHNPPAPGLLDLCDELGFLVVNEVFDGWERGKRPNDYGRWFADWHEADVRAWVRRDRNHPCVIAWSIGNEVGEQNSVAGLEIATRLRRFVREEDVTRPVAIACNNIKAGFNGFQTRIDVFGFNYKPELYARFRAENPAVPLVGAETASTVSTRDYYTFATDDMTAGPGDFQVSSYDLETPKWGTLPDREFAAQDDTPGIAGEFVWTGCDYLGEPTPFNVDPSILLNAADAQAAQALKRELGALKASQLPSRSSYFGLIDLAGFPKDRYYLYLSRWRPELRMAHLLPHWTWPGREGLLTPVHLYTSGDEAELFLNGRSVGIRRKGPRDYRLRWNEVAYEPGTLRVVVYRSGQPWVEAERHTAGTATKVDVTADRTEIAADPSELAFVTVRLLDSNGNVDPSACGWLRMDVQGPGHLVATDNGDPTDLSAFQSPERRAFHGYALVIVRATGPGVIKVTVRSVGLLEGSVVIASV